jgi:hypothetical protein
VLRAARPCELALERIDLVPADEPARRKHALERFSQLGLELSRLAPQVEEGDGHR